MRMNQEEAELLSGKRAVASVEPEATPEMSNAIAELRIERREFENKIRAIDKAIEVLDGSKTEKCSTMSKAKRLAISKAQKANWAKFRAFKKKTE